MTREKYSELRQKIGTQKDVAALLGVSRTTVVKRESGAWGISIEAGLAIQAVSVGKRDALLRDVPAKRKR